MGKKAIYRRVGWQDKVLSVAHENKSEGLVDLANEDGETVVTSLPIFKEDPDPAEGFKSWAILEGKASSGPSIDEAQVEYIVGLATSGNPVETCELESLNKPTLSKIAGSLAILHDSRTSKGDLIDLIHQFTLEQSEMDDDHPEQELPADEPEEEAAEELDDEIESDS